MNLADIYLLLLAQVTFISTTVILKTEIYSALSKSYRILSSKLVFLHTFHFRLISKHVAAFISFGYFTNKRLGTRYEEEVVMFSTPSRASDALCREANFLQWLPIWGVNHHAIHHPHCNPEIACLTE